MELVCRKCGSTAAHKSGMINGVQRYKCKQCGYQYTKTTPQGKPAKDKLLALLFCFSGLSMNVSAKIIGVTAQSVMRWVRQSEKDYKAEMSHKEKIQELDASEIQQYFQKKGREYGCKKFLTLEIKTAAGKTLNILIPKR